MDKHLRHVMTALILVLVALVPTPARATATDGKIVFVRDGSIYAVNADDTSYQRLTFAGGDRYPRWSPDGTRILYVHSNQLRVMDSDGSHPTSLTPASETVYGAGWSPDGSRVVVVSSGSLYTMAADGTDRVQLLGRVAARSGDTDTVRPSNGDLDPAWSPDGSTIAFTRNHDGFLEGIWHEIVALDVATKQFTYANGDGPDDWDGSVSPEWTPDGKLAYTFIDNFIDGHPQYIAIEGVRLDSPGGDFAISPDGSGLVIDTALQQRLVIWSLSDHSTRLIGHGVMHDPDWAAGTLPPGPTCNGLPATIIGTPGNDTLRGTSGPDVIVAGSGNDLIDPGTGTDTVCGGAGFDTADYGTHASGVQLSLDEHANDGTPGESDNLLGFEALRGSPYRDGLTGSATNNVIRGGGGDDVIDGAGGNDTEYGGAGNDAFRQGSGGPNGNDTLFGGDGHDKVTYEGRATGVHVSRNNIADDGGPGEYDDVRADVERQVGTSFGDRLVGGTARDWLFGLGGPDLLIGGYGADAMYGGDGGDGLLARDETRDVVDGGPGVDQARTDGFDVRRSLEATL